jgi:hypothetical protein
VHLQRTPEFFFPFTSKHVKSSETNKKGKVKKAERERGNGEVGVKKSIKEILFLS